MPERLEENSSVDASAGDYTATAVPAAPPVGIEAEGKVEPVRDRGLSPSAMIWKKLRRNRTAMFGLYTLAVLYISAVLAGFIAPYKYDNAAHDFPFYPPMITRIHLFDERGEFTRPFVYGIIPDDPTLATYHYDFEKKYPLRFFVRGESYHILWIIRSDIHLFGVDEPGRIFLFGSDVVGQDIFSRILYGAQVSLSIGIVGIMVSTLIGIIAGAVAGYLGGPTDFLLMRLVEAVLAIPSTYFVLVMRQMFGATLSSGESYLIIIIIFVFIGWAMEARVIRGMVLALKEQEYVIAARALGYTNTRIILKHILPNTFSFVIVTATLTVPFYILGEVALSFLGVGIQEPEASWGNMLSAAQTNRYLYDFPWMLIPGVFIFIAVMAWNFLGDGLRDAADPRTLN